MRKSGRPTATAGGRRSFMRRQTSAIREGLLKVALTWEGPLGVGIDTVSSLAIRPAV
jgi:hypothetical protein